MGFALGRFAPVVARFAAALALLAFCAAMLAIPADEARADSGHSGDYPLHYAAEFGRLAEVNHFLTVHMTDVNVKNDKGQTPLHLAANATRSWCSPAVVLTLIAAGADVNATADPGFSGRYRATPLNEAIHWQFTGSLCPGVVAVLVDAGAKICNGQGCSFNAWSPLYSLAQKGVTIAAVITVAQIFIQRGDDVNDGGSGRTPLYEAWRGAANTISGHDWFDLVNFLIENGGHYGTECTGEWVVNPRPISNLSALRRGERDACICQAEKPVKKPNGICEIAAVCDSPAVVDAVANRCDCPAPNIGTDAAAAPGNCQVSSVQVCGGTLPPSFYSPTLSVCAPYKECQTSATLNRETNFCECAGAAVLDGIGTSCLCKLPNLGTPDACQAPSVESCAELNPTQFYDPALISITTGECVPFKSCAGGTLDQKTNTCECTGAAELDGAENNCECLAPNLNFGDEDCRAPSVANCAEHYDPPKFFDPTRVSITAGECTERLYPCHDSAVRKADNSGCECPAGAYAHSDPSGGEWDNCERYYSSGRCRQTGKWRQLIPTTAICHADHTPLAHNVVNSSTFRNAVRANNPTLVAHYIAEHGQDPDRSYQLHSAVINGYHLAAKALIEGGADVDLRDTYATPLHRAMWNERAELITLLLQRGANVNEKDKGGDAPMHSAAGRSDTAENIGLVSFLLNKSADPNIRNDSGWRPLDLAYHGGNARTWQARRGIMAALIAGGADWSDECSGGAIPNENYRGAAQVAIYPECKCPSHISQRDGGGNCECPTHSHAQVNGQCLPQDSAQVEAGILEMQAELMRLRGELVSLNAQLSASAEMPRAMVEGIAEQAGAAAREIAWRRDNLIALARADLAGPPPPPVALSDTATECRMLGGEVQIHSATGIRVCSNVDRSDTFCLVDSNAAFPCQGLFRHVRVCNDDYNRPALNPFLCGEKCGAQNAVGKECQ